MLANFFLCRSHNDYLILWIPLRKITPTEAFKVISKFSPCPITGTPMKLASSLVGQGRKVIEFLAALHIATESSTANNGNGRQELILHQQ